MRLSRRAGLLACGIRWIKYECSKNSYWDGSYDFGQNQWKLILSGQNINYYVQGYSDYKVSWSDTQNKYVYLPAGTQADASPRYPGTVYCIQPTFIERETVNKDGTYYVYSRDLYTVKHYVDEYPAGDIIGSVRAAKDAYPDEKNGYTYVTEYDGYTIMKDGNSQYFAYKKA